MFRYALIFFLFFINLSTYGEENHISFKQQLDRLQRDVNDLSKFVYQKNIHDIESGNKVESDNSINISAFDMRIYDLEKDIKTLNLNFEEVTFYIDELKKLYDELIIKIDTNLINKSKDYHWGRWAYLSGWKMGRNENTGSNERYGICRTIFCFECKYRT